MKTRTSRAATPLAVLAATFTVASTAAAQESPRAEAPVSLAPPPPADDVRVERRLMPELYVTGPILFGFTYGATVAITAGVAQKPDVGRATAYAAIPIVGPWVLLGSNLPTMSYTAALVASGIGQAAGLGVTIAGLLVRRDVKVPTIATDKVRVSFVPAGGGAYAIGSF
jgi:hypothetical protein